MWLYLGVATGAQVGTAFITFGVASLIPFLVSSLHLNATQAGLVGGAANVGMMAMGLPAGRLADRYGEKRVIIWGCVLTGLSIMGSSRAGSFELFYPLLLLTGLWAGSLTPAGSRAIVNWFPASRRGLAQSIRQTGVTTGGLLAALILPPLAFRLDGRTALALAGLTGLAGAVLTGLLYHEAPDRRPTGDGKGRGTLVEVVRNRNILLTCASGVFFLGTQFALLSYLQLFLRAKAGIPPARTGLFLAVLIAAGLAGRVFWGFLSDLGFRGAKRPALVATGLIAAGTSLSMLGIGPATPRLLIAGQTFLLGFTALGWNGVSVALLADLGRGDAATAVGLGISAIQLGVLFLTPVFGYLVDRTGTYAPSWLFLAAVLLAGVLLATLVREKGKEDAAPAG